jgi:hypothetical protein
VRIFLRILCVLAAAGLLSGAERQTRNLILVTADGLRWQEVFRGLDPLLRTEKEAGMAEAGADALRQRLWAETPRERREKLLPFLWQTLAARGVILGNRDQRSTVEVTNAYRVSYPGYSEILTCRAQNDRIRGNDPIRNPRETVLEYVKRAWRLRTGQVALFGSWDTFRFIGESREGTVFLNAGYRDAQGSARLEELSRVQHEALTPWPEARHDYVTVEMALEYLRRFQPRFLYVALDETDDWAHAKRYDRVLETAQYFDHALRRLWETAQSLPAYRGKTSLVVTSDHGRGSQLADWTSHGTKVEGAAYIWLAAMGPDTPARGEAGAGETYRQRDISATLLSLAGLEWQGFCEGGGQPVELIAPGARGKP